MHQPKPRISLILLTLLFILILFPISAKTVHAEYDPDVTPPNIDISSMTVTLPEGKTKATVGDTVTLTIKVTDDTAVSSLYWLFKNPVTGKRTALYADYIGYNQETKNGLWQATFEVTNHTENGIWKIYEISSRDPSNNGSSYANTAISPYDGSDLSAFNFEVEGTPCDPDITKPTLDFDKTSVSITNGKSKATVGDTVTISTNATDDRGMRSVQWVYTTPISGNTKYLNATYAGEDETTKNGLWKIDFEITDETESGIWKLESINIVDTSENSPLIRHMIDFDPAGLDLSPYNFEVEGTSISPDIKAPVIDITSMTRTITDDKSNIKTNAEASAGDTVTFTAEMTDDTAIYYAQWYMISPAGKRTLLDTKYIGKDETTKNGLWQATLAVTDETATGTWKIEFITMCDTSMNYSWYHNSDVDYIMGDGDLSSYNFNVIAPECPYDLSAEGYSMMLDGEDATKTFGGVYYIKTLNGKVTPNVKVRFDDANSWTTLSPKKYNLVFEKKTGEDTWEYYYSSSFGIDEDGTATYRVHACGNSSLFYHNATQSVEFQVVMTHDWTQIIQKATPTEDGLIYLYCEYCDAKEDVTPIPKASNISLTKTSYIYTGKAIKPAVIVATANETLAAENYTVSYAKNVSAGTATATINLQGDYYTGSVTRTFTISKAANPLKIKAKTATIRYSRLRKKAQSLAASKVISFTRKGKGSLSYSKISGNKKITINKKTGKVTAKKGLKKGTYKVKVKVKAAGTANYKASGWKTISFRIKVN